MCIRDRLPGYLQAEQGFSLAKTGWVAAIPFLAAAVGMWVNGIVVDRPVSYTHLDVYKRQGIIFRN